MQVDINGEARLSLSDCLTRRSATSLIGFYQRYISPHKGFRCAHRVYHGGQSCSGYAKTVVQSHGLGAALPLIRRRFADCGQVARMMHSQGVSSVPKSRLDRLEKERRERNSNCWADSVGDCAFYGCDIGADDCDGCGDLDLGGCDGCDACDVAGCDF